MGADVAGQALELASQVEQLADVGVGLVKFRQVLALLDCLIERNAERRRHHRRELVDTGQRHAEGAADILDGGPGGHGVEGADLGDHLLAVLLLDVTDDLAAAILAEVDVDIGSLFAVKVQEPLEQQVVFDRANVAQIEGIADQRPHATAAGGRRHVELAGVANEVPHDQEVIRKAELVDDP